MTPTFVLDTGAASAARQPLGARRTTATAGALVPGSAPEVLASGTRRECRDRISGVTITRMTEQADGNALRDFLERYPCRSYERSNGDYPSVQLAPVGPADGLLFLNTVPETPPTGTPRRTHDENGENCHLWVIDERGRPCVSEAPLARLGSGNLHHTNLTGGQDASIGGEVWFDEMPRVYLSGSSGRYPPRDREHLEHAEQLFRSVGFEVLSLGWDQEHDKPQRLWLGQRPVAWE